jgi:hypothetical protein
MIANEQEVPFPSFNDLVDYAEAGVIRRTIARLLIPQDSAASIKRHEKFGTASLKKAFRSVVRAAPPNTRGYRLDGRADRLGAVTDFALKDTVSREMWHAAGVGGHAGILVWSATELGLELRPESIAMTAFNVGWLAVHGGFAALQRYHRTRMVHVVDKGLLQGREFDCEYRNWLGIDSRAINNFQESLAPLSTSGPSS